MGESLLTRHQRPDGVSPASRLGGYRTRASLLRVRFAGVRGAGLPGRRGPEDLLLLLLGRAGTDVSAGIAGMFQ